MMNNEIDLIIAQKSVTLYPAKKSDSPLIVLNNYLGNGSDIVQAMEDTDCADCHLLNVSGLNWDHDMAPWYCPPLTENDTPCTGGADEYLKLLLDEILPEMLVRIDGEPTFVGIAGYSLAGLFALYAMYRTDRFSRAASMSGSLWFPDFKEYAISHELKLTPDKLYLSLGDKEAQTDNAMLRTVQDNTEFLAEHYRGLGFDTEYELNVGNHYNDATLRTAKGIAALLK